MSDKAARLARWDAWLAMHSEDALDAAQPIVDPHHHLWDRGGHCYLAGEYLTDARAHALRASVFVECLANYDTAGPAELRCVGETRAVMTWTAAARTAVAAGIVGYADLTLGADVGRVLDAHLLAAGTRFKGIRYVTAYDADTGIPRSYPTRAGMLLDPLVQAGARELARRGLSLDLWMYFHQLPDALALARACPELRLVIDHAGGPIGVGPYAGHRAEVFDRWRAALGAVASLPNVTLKFGGLAMALAGFDWRERAAPPTSEELAQAWRPYFEVCLERFGARRCMFESNFPVDRTGCSFTVLWNAFKRLAHGSSDDERDALCARTASEFYRLGQPIT